ncbi:hypothetical protein M408DRAFT_333071 [Serendipita vermifera MAFF 305830]|uniref:Uncharacterized protein n=1 Tax=Serendipita vermifera MAFF 305830 TaxID=933852 RepID=A0A0C3APZ4_SERVB|nr:hypothetical protein M408DRAFT_333071 [Serendipita vermifera MAFF 305830]
MMTSLQQRQSQMTTSNQHTRSTHNSNGPGRCLASSVLSLTPRTTRNGLVLCRIAGRPTRVHLVH